MSRTILWIVSVFLALAMVAMIIVQGYWIKRSMDLEENQLGMVVNQVLSELSDELVQNETVITILDEIRPPLIQYKSQAVWNFHIDARSAYNGSEDENIHIEAEDLNENQDQDVYTYTSPDHSLKNQKVKMINDSLLVVLGEDLLLHDTILVSAMHPEQVRNKLKKEVQESVTFVERIVRRMLVEEEQVMDKISGAQIEAILSEKFFERGVKMPFEYAAYEEGKKPIFQSEQFNEFEDCNYFRTSLFPGSVYNQSTLISVYFPGERQHLRKSMGIMGGSSLLITIFIITMFSLTLYIIFKQKRLSEMKNDFVNNMTHELKTPISTISLASQMLNDRSIPKEQKNLGQISRIIQAETKQLGFQVERVLQMAIFDHGQLKLKSAEVDIHDLIETVAQNFLLQMDKRGGKLEFLPEADQAVVKGDQMHLTNVISNLLENAMKYTGRTPEITISTSNKEGMVVLSVADNGIGISKEDQKRIFDKFYRVPTGNVHNVKGFGLGLSYVKLIVEQHGGSIQIKSEPNKGSRFNIHLPLQEQ
ncbi:MAG: HAMP domain-containing histidine kinase [Bacteroidales bacterium]|nr:HAMP domain-containing histidine kinase [Bacteroidales bacterium]